MSELIRREDLENWLRTECYGTDTDDDKEYVIGRMRKELPTIDAVPVEIIKHYKAMWKSRAQSGHFSDRIANGMMAQAAEIMLNNHEMTNSFTEV